ncbi:MAG: hypothetical protein ACI3XQ_06590, partial [Eubacteriales bacterium]
MDRTKFLELARHVSMKSAMYRHPEFNDSEMVTYSGAKYLPIAYKLSFKGDGSARHTAVLRDIKADSVVEVRLDEVGEVEPALKCPTARPQPAGDAENENMNKCSGEK